MTAISTRLNTFFFRGVSITPLVAFRIIFGSLMLFGIVRFISKGWVNELYIQPRFFFPYLGFEWITPLPGNWMYLPFIVMCVAAVGMIIGWRYRITAMTFFLCFTYVELLDKSNYLNHYYFVSLVSFLMCLVPANAAFSLDARANPAIRKTVVPAWTIRIIQLQLGIVYFFAGVAKLHTDWLFHAQPLRTWLQAYRDLPVIGSWFSAKWLAFAFSWFGCIYDLSIPFFLSFRRTRSFAYFFVIVFHIVTWMLFPIGVFPWVMIFSTLIFFPAAFHERWLAWVGRKTEASLNENAISSRNFLSKPIRSFLMLYLAVQILIPFRYALYPGNLFWTEEGFRFSWRVMLMHKEGYATFYVVDPKTQRSIQIHNEDYLSPVQTDQMATQPDMILQFAHHIGEIYQDTVLTYGSQSVHLRRPRVEAEVFVSLNGRPHMLYISRKTDLMHETYSLKHRKWLEPFKETDNF